MAVETLAAFRAADKGMNVQPVVVVTKGTDGEIYLAESDPVTGGLVVTAAVVVNPPVGGFATETTQLNVLAAVDGLETLATSTNTKLDTLHTDNTAIEGYIDGIETLIGSTNTKLDTLHADSVLVQGYVDGIEALVASTNTKIDSTNTKLDTLHSDSVLIQGYVDGLETLVTSSNTKLDTLHSDSVIIQGYIDGLETLVTSSNTKLDTVHTDLVNLLTLQKPEYARAIAPVLHNFASTGITASAYTQVIASTAAKAIRWQFSNTSGMHLTLATGAPASEVPFCIIPPGGAVEIDILIAASTRISVTSDENVSTGKLSVVGLV